jgi:hypothetical protein
LHGIKAPQGHAVATIQHYPPEALTSTEAIDRIQGKAGPSLPLELDKPDDPS